MTVAFNLTLTEDDWETKFTGWRCSVFSIPGASVEKILVNGEEDDLQNYTINRNASMIYWNRYCNRNRNKPDQITVLITFDDPQLSSSEQTKKWKRIATIATPIGLLVTAIFSAFIIFKIKPNPPEVADPKTPETLEKVSKEGKLKCGIDGNFRGFSVIESIDSNDKKNYSGFEADYCRVIAVAIFGNAIINSTDGSKTILEKIDDKIDFKVVPLDEPDRFESVEKGEVDVLIQHASWTTVRELKYDITFGAPIFYDEQIIIAKKSSEIEKQEDLGSLEGTERKLCVSQGTTSETNIIRYLKDNEIEDSILNKVEAKDTKSFLNNLNNDDGLCDAIIADSSQILTHFHGKIDQDNSEDNQDRNFQLVKLENTIAQEILSPVFIEGDPEWRDVINYSIYATIRATELGISQANVGSIIENNKLSSDDKEKRGIKEISLEVKQLLGIDDSKIGEKLNLDKEFAKNIIQLVGKYYDIFDRNLSKEPNNFYPSRTLNKDSNTLCLYPEDNEKLEGDEERLKGDKNQLWTCGGILISPPFAYDQEKQD